MSMDVEKRETDQELDNDFSKMPVGKEQEIAGSLDALGGLKPIPDGIPYFLTKDKPATYGASRLTEAPAKSPEFREFYASKSVHLKGGPLDGVAYGVGATADPDCLLYFFREVRGEIEQAVYRIVLVEREKAPLGEDATDEERKAWRELPKVFDWVGEWVGKRKCLTVQVNGIRKGS